MSLKWDLETVHLTLVSRWFWGCGATDQLLRPRVLNLRENHTKQKFILPQTSISGPSNENKHTLVLPHLDFSLLVHWVAVMGRDGEKIKENGKSYRPVNNEPSERLTWFRHCPNRSSHFIFWIVGQWLWHMPSHQHCDARQGNQQFSSFQLLSCVRLCATPSTSPKLISIESVMPSNHLILCRPLLLLPSIFPSIRVFSNESALHIKWPKYWSFSFNISPSNEINGSSQMMGRRQRHSSFMCLEFYLWNEDHNPCFMRVFSCLINICKAFGGLLI